MPDRITTSHIHLGWVQGAGSVCLDVINQTWSPMFDLVNVFETFLPQVGARSCRVVGCRVLAGGRAAAGT